MCCCLLLSSNLPKVSYWCMSESLKNSFLPNACFVEDLVLMIIFKAVVNPFLLFFFHYMWHRFESVSDSTPAFLRVKRSLSQPISSLGGLKTHLQVEIRHWRAAGSGGLQAELAAIFVLNLCIWFIHHIHTVIQVKNPKEAQTQNLSWQEGNYAPIKEFWTFESWKTGWYTACIHWYTETLYLK